MRPRASTESSKPNVAREVTRRGPDQGELQTSAPFMLGVLPFAINSSVQLLVPISAEGKVAIDPLHATIEEFAAEGYTHIACH
jgi:hypothetical protein